MFDITSHGETEKELNLNVKLWHDGHYLPDGSVECRLPDDKKDISMEAYVKERWPTFVEFYLWALAQHGQDKHYKGWLYLSSLTTIPDGFKLPDSIGGSLDLRSLTTIPDGFKLPDSIGGSLYLSSLTTIPDGFKLPDSIGGSLYLSDALRKKFKR